MAPQPKSIADEIGEDIAGLINTGVIFAPDDPRILELEERGKKLAKSFPGTGYVDLAAVSMLCGNYSQMFDRYKIALSNGANYSDKTNYGTALAHSGYYSKAATIFKSVLDKLDDPVFAVSKAVLGMQFRLFTDLTQKLDLMHPEGTNNGFSKEARNEYLGFSQLLMEMKMDDSTIAGIMDMAGQVLREHKTYSKSVSDLLTTKNNEPEKSIVVCTLRIPKGCSEASDMTMEFADHYLASKYASFADKYMVRFAGEY